MKPVNVYKHHLDSFYLTFQFSKHLEMKQTMLTLMAEQSLESLIVKDDYHGDNITKLDWSMATNFTRPWVNYFKPKLDALLNDVATVCGYIECHVDELWFQQYKLNDIHGWHTHGSNFTGVYYLDLSDDAPKTQLVNPFNQEQIIMPDIKEGDILIFPSFVIHRAPKIKENINKTIVSFNCNFSKINVPVLNNITAIAENF
jgi:hypothetical protein